MCACVFVLKCLCLSLVSRSEAAERQRPPFHPLTPLSLVHTEQQKWEERGREETIRGRKEEHQRVRQDPVLLILLSGSQGYFTPSPAPPPPPAFLSSVAVIRKGRSKGAAECHCSVLALRAAELPECGQEWRFRGVLAPLHHDEG